MNSADEEFDRLLKSDLQRIESDERLARLQSAISQLPSKDREAFVLRNIGKLNVSDTAVAMGCSADNVNTHYWRAVHALRDKLGEV
jgi:RNA polymerase sigma-70 factor, ECF subfamily